MKLIRFLLLLSALLASLYAIVAKSEELPEGCYVSYSDPIHCFEYPEGTYFQWDAALDSNVIAPKYGQIVAAIIAWGWNYQQNYEGCSSVYDAWNALAPLYNKKLKLIKKLRKACGKKCRRVK